MSGPLSGVKVVELAGIGPTPFAGMVLSDMGAEVLRIDKVDSEGNPVAAFGGAMERGKKSVSINLKTKEGVETAKKIIAASDVLLEGFRAGVAERLGIGPDVCLQENPSLVYARMTGWGQEGPMAKTAGHDINYISLASPLAHIGRKGELPTVPLNLIGDFGGGSLFLVMGICAALFEVARKEAQGEKGGGQVVDAAMVDGASYLMSPLYGASSSGFWSDERGTNLLDSGAHFYDVYETSDGRYMAVGAIEPQFYAELLKGLELDAEELPAQMERENWHELKKLFTDIFKQKTQKEWTDIFAGTDACTTPVLTMKEAPQHPQAKERNSFFDFQGAAQPSPAPRWSATAAEPSQLTSAPGADTRTVLEAAGFSEEEIAELAAGRHIGFVKKQEPKK